MNKNEFIIILRKELNKLNVKEIDEIIEDFEEHFEFKLEEGKTEAEIVKKMGDPQDIAKEYANQEEDYKKRHNKTIIVGLGLIDIIMFLIFTFMWLSVLVIATFTISSLALAFCLITTINMGGLIPDMPYLSSLIFGLSSLGMVLLSAIGTIYLTLYLKQWVRVYLRWHKNVLNNNIYPTLSMHPKLSKKTASTMKLLLMLGMIIFFTMVTLGYIVSAILAQHFEFWHIWDWFV